jgi:hypothetical protein
MPTLPGPIAHTPAVQTKLVVVILGVDVAALAVANVRDYCTRDHQGSARSSHIAS